MRILFIVNYRPFVGGISGQVEILQQKLSKEGIVADIFQTKGSVYYRLGLFRRLCKLGGNYDVFHIHCCSDWGFLPAVIGIRVGKKLGKRIVLTYHGGGADEFFSKHTRLIKKYLLKTDVNIALSGFLGAVFDKYEIPYTIIPNIIELDESHFRRRDVIKPNYICIRALEPLYNHACVLKAFQIVKSKLQEATLTIVGGGSSKEELEKMVEDLNLNDVRFVGRVQSNEIYQYLNQSDIMVSAPHVDNMPVSLIEGMNAGLLIISSSVGGVPYMVEDGINGLLFKDDDYKGLSAKMIWAVNHQVEAQKIVMNGFDMSKEYSWDNIKDGILNIYD